MFKKMLAAVGIGGAKVDTVLHTEHLLPGQPFSATVHIKGGQVEQTITGLDLALKTQVKETIEVDDEEREVMRSMVLATWRVAHELTLESEQTLTIPFEGVLPQETPMTVLPAKHNLSKVWLETGLDISSALDAKDKDYLHVVPNDAVNTALIAMDELGFKFVKADVEKGYLSTSVYQTQSGCYQELEFKPSGFGLFSTEEVELSFVMAEDETLMVLEVDRRFGSDSYKELVINHNNLNLEDLKEAIKHLIHG